MLYITHKQTLTYSFSSQKSINKNKKMFFTNIFFDIFSFQKKTSFFSLRHFMQNLLHRFSFLFFFFFHIFLYFQNLCYSSSGHFPTFFHKTTPIISPKKESSPFPHFSPKFNHHKKNVLFTHEQKQ